MSPAPILRVENLAKTFTLHTQGGVRLPVFEQVNFTVSPGECVVLACWLERCNEVVLRAPALRRCSRCSDEFECERPTDACSGACDQDDAVCELWA